MERVQKLRIQTVFEANRVSKLIAKINESDYHISTSGFTKNPISNSETKLISKSIVYNNPHSLVDPLTRLSLKSVSR